MASMTVPNYGLLQGLADGLKQGLISYQTQKNIQHDQQLQNIMAQAEPDANGNLQPSAGLIAQRQAAAAKAGYETGTYSSEGPQAESMRQAARGLLNKQQPGFGDEAISDQMSPAAIKDLSPLMKPEITGVYNLQGKQVTAGQSGQNAQTSAGARVQAAQIGANATMQRIQNTNQNQGNRLQLQANRQYSQEMGNTENQLMSSNRASALINGIKAGDLQGTTQLKSDLSAALAQMVAGKPPTVYGMSHQDFDSAYGRVQHAYGFLSGETPGTITDAQLTQLQKDVNALRNEYGLQHQNKFNSFEQGLPDKVKPGLENRASTFRQGAGISQPSGQGLIDQGQPQNQPPGGHQTVIQNGHTYQWNPQTGKYE